MTDIENAESMGKRIGDMNRSELLEVIGRLSDDLQSARAAHTRTLDVWTIAQRAKTGRRGLWSNLLR